jgi:hypothetical protein
MILNFLPILLRIIVLPLNIVGKMDPLILHSIIIYGKHFKKIIKLVIQMKLFENCKSTIIKVIRGTLILLNNRVVS